MPRSLRKPMKAKGSTPPPDESTPVARGAVRRAQKVIDAEESSLEAKVQAMDRLLPKGFTPALNPDLLPAAIRAKTQMSPQEVLSGIDPHDGFMPTPQQIEAVYDYAKWGVPLDSIRLKIVNPLTGKPISTDTLRKYFHMELLLGDADAKVEISRTAYHMATPREDECDKDGKVIKPGREANPSVLIALSKHRLKWFDNRNVIVTHDVGVEPDIADALKQLTPDELRTLRTIADRRADQKAEGGPQGD